MGILNSHIEIFCKLNKKGWKKNKISLNSIISKHSFFFYKKYCTWCFFLPTIYFLKVHFFIH